MANEEMDKTVFLGMETGDSAAKELPSSIRPVTDSGTTSRKHSAYYIAQQTSLEEYTPGLNPLVNAAAPLLLTIVRLRRESGFTQSSLLVSQGGPRPESDTSHIDSMDIESLRTRLEAEIRGFENQALVSDMDQSQVLAARYLLCTAVDEAVTTSRFGESGEWSRFALLSTFHNETWGGEKFFQILDRCMQQPARNLYLLELMYLLISLGFEGKFRVLDRGPIAIESLRDKIYRQVRLLRGEPAQDLSKKIDPTKKPHKIYRYIPAWLVAVVVIFCTTVTFWGFSQALSSHASPLLQELSTLTSVLKGSIL